MVLKISGSPAALVKSVSTLGILRETRTKKFLRFTNRDCVSIACTCVHLNPAVLSPNISVSSACKELPATSVSPPIIGA